MKSWKVIGRKRRKRLRRERRDHFVSFVKNLGPISKDKSPNFENCIFAAGLALLADLPFITVSNSENR